MRHIDTSARQRGRTTDLLALARAYKNGVFIVYEREEMRTLQRQNPDMKDRIWSVADLTRETPQCAHVFVFDHRVTERALLENERMARTIREMKDIPRPSEPPWMRYKEEPTPQQLCTLTDRPHDIVRKLAMDNPGAMRACTELLAFAKQIDTSNPIAEITYLLFLDSLHIYGSELYSIYGDICRGNITAMVAVLWLIQRGHLSKSQLLDNITGHMIPNHPIQKVIYPDASIKRVMSMEPEFVNGKVNYNTQPPTFEPINEQPTS